jgi:hypothetical protein
MINFKHNVNNSKSLIILICLFSLFFSSCTTIRKTLREPLKERGADYLFENLKRNEVKYKWLSAKFSAVIDYEGKKNSFNGILRVRNDSAIWISITPALGIEAARLLISNDSIKLINRFNKTYIKGDYDFINTILNTGFDFDMIESLLTGNDFAYYDIDKFKAKIDNGEYKLTTVNRQKIKRYVRRSREFTRILLQDIWLNPDNFKITRTSINEIKENRKLDVEYSGFTKIGNQVFPEKIEFKLADKNPIRFTVKYSKITFGEPQSFPFRIPEGYEKMIKHKTNN